MLLRYNHTPERKAMIAAALPSEKLTESLSLAILEASQPVLLESLRKEIEIYKSYPKAGKMDTFTFNTTNHKTCFMGQGFRVSNGGVGDADLYEYRDKVGVLNHKMWGDATLLEIWGADHFDSHRDMVKGVFEYCKGERDTLPELRFYVSPFFKNKKSGRFTYDDSDRAAAMEKYIIELNGMLANYGRKPVNELTGDYLKDFNQEWERRKAGLDI